jgi:hypothetical protein
VATGLVAGTTYNFKVQAKNGYGLSAYSNIATILAAQRPDTPAAPTTAVSGANVVISWTQPFTGGSAITSYVILVRLFDSISYY